MRRLLFDRLRRFVPASLDHDRFECRPADGLRDLDDQRSGGESDLRRVDTSFVFDLVLRERDRRDFEWLRLRDRRLRLRLRDRERRERERDRDRELDRDRDRRELRLVLERDLNGKKKFH